MDEIEKLQKAVDDFSKKMMDKLKQKAYEGYTGWDNPKYKNHLKK